MVARFWWVEILMPVLLDLMIPFVLKDLFWVVWVFVGSARSGRVGGGVELVVVLLMSAEGSSWIDFSLSE